jgi:hypothetical protein
MQTTFCGVVGSSPVNGQIAIRRSLEDELG